MKSNDPWLADRLRAEDRLRRHERLVEKAVLAALKIWLDTARALILHQPIPPAAVALLSRPVTASGDEPPELDAAGASFGAWRQAMSEHIDPALVDAFGEGFLADMRTADISPLPYQLEYMEQVHDRLKIWPEGAFEELRPELLEAISEAETYDQVQDRIGMVLGIDAPTRRIRADISAVDRRIAEIDALIDNPDTPPELFPDLRSERRGLRGERRVLWERHDASLGEWQWLARRIARTEVHAAIVGGELAAQRAAASITGERMYKAWLATSDDRTRFTHQLAEGQIVALDAEFQVGAARLQFPGDPFGPGHETINCRCTLRFLTEHEMQTELQGKWGGRGVAPMSARLGPDDPDDVAAAAKKLEAERRGEKTEWPTDVERAAAARQVAREHKRLKSRLDALLQRHIRADVDEEMQAAIEDLQGFREEHGLAGQMDARIGRGFDEDERTIVDLLRSEGRNVVSIPKKKSGAASPDMAVGRIHAEIKTSLGGDLDRFVDKLEVAGQRQARRIFINATKTRIDRESLLVEVNRLVADGVLEYARVVGTDFDQEFGRW